MEAGNKAVGVLEKVAKMVKEYGFFNLIKSILIIALFLATIIAVNSLPDIIKNSINHTKQEQVAIHDRAIEIRKRIKPQIDEELKNMMLSVKADRIFILELHNGTNNTAGLPFLYAEMTYSYVGDKVSNIDDDYNNLNLSRFSFPLYLENNQYWIGTVEELKDIDEKLALRLMSNDVKYLAIMTIQGTKTELGYYGVTYTNDTIISDERQYIMQLTRSSQKISTLLDMPSYADYE